MVNEMQPPTVFSIGHSTHSYERFLELLKNAGVNAIADVRTSPYSRHFPQFSRDSLRDSLREDGIAYSFLGKELGGRPTGTQYYSNGVANYELMAQSPDFSRGLQRVMDGAQEYRIALMCSEQAPLDCHRCLLIGRALAKRGLPVNHILTDGTIADHNEIEEQLLKSEGLYGDDLFLSPEERLARAYRVRSNKVAFSEQHDGSLAHSAAK